MKIVTFHPQGGNEPHTGALITATDEILDFESEAADLPESEGPFSWFDLAGPCLPLAEDLARQLETDAARRDDLRAAGALVTRSGVRLCAPVPRPGKVICIGLNYKDHAAESKMDLPERPLMFSKFSSCVIGPDDAVECPPGSENLDYEAELGVVVGQVARRVPVERAYDYVLGYTNVNDVSARDFQFADGQWQRGKSCDTFCPSGPYIATKDEIPDPQTLAIRFRLNGETLQDSRTDQLIFTVPELIAQLSEAVTLEPGDLIATGTPPGVGFARKPPVWVQSGDVMEVEIEGLGVLRNARR